MAWQTPKTNWSSADGVRDTDMNRIEGNALELKNTKAELVAFSALQQRVENALFENSQRTQIGNLAIGAEFGLYENGILTPFIKLESNYAGSGRTLVIRKDIVKMDTLFTSGNTYYENSKQDTWLNNSYITTLDAATQNVISAVSVPVITSAGDSSISRKAFILSLTEYNQNSVYMPTSVGNSIVYFNSNARRVARFNGAAAVHWTRSINSLASPPTAVAINSAGDGTGELNTATTSSYGIRPAFTLPTTYEVVASMPSTANVLASAEVI